MQSLESLMQVQMTQQIIKLLNSMQSVTIGGLTLDANLKTRVQVVSNSAQENLTKDQSQNQNQANTKNANSNKALNQQNSANQTNTAKAPLTNAQVADAKVANTNSQTYNVILKLMDGRNINVNLPKPLPVGAKLELVMSANNKGVLRPLPNADKSVQAQAQNQIQNSAKSSQTSLQNLQQNSAQNLAQNQATNKPILTQEQLQNVLTQNLTKALPKQMPLNEFLQQLQTSITKIATQANISHADKIAIRQALRQILQHFPQKNDSVPTAQEIKNAIKNNGVLFEANLAKLANFSASAPTNSPINAIGNSSTNITLDLKFLLQRASILLQNSLANAGNTGAKSASFQTNANQANSNFAGANQTLGANLANTANLTNMANLSQAQTSQSLLQAQAQSQAQSSSANAQNNAQVNAQANQTNANAQNAGANTNTQNAQAQANQASSNEVLQQVSKLLDSAMAKIQTQQHTALQQTNTADNRGVTQNLQVSIPFFAGGTWQNVDLELNKLDSESSSNSTSETNRREKIWQVTLNFALRDWGKISTRLVLRGENLRADLWLETDDKRQKMELASESLAARLRSIGAEVEKITFHTGAIAKQQQRISSTDQLIDTLV